MAGAALDSQSIRQLILQPEAGYPPLVQEFLSLEEQLQPNGFDLSLQTVARFTSAGQMGRDAQARILSESSAVPFGEDDWLFLPAGIYLIAFNEIVNFPLNLMGLGCPRSSLLRSGVSINTAVWDAGYRGRSQALLTVHNSLGYHLQKGARLLQLVFFRLARSAAQGYQGNFQDEGR